MKSPLAITVQLIHIHGPLKGDIQEFLDDCISIGRNPGSSVCFPVEMTALSRRHAEIQREGNQFKLIDYSVNGTLVNGKKVKETLLRDGDVLEFSEGGPKVSFLTKVADTPAEVKKPAPAPVVASAPVVEPPVSPPAPLEPVEPVTPEPVMPVVPVTPVTPTVSPAKELPVATPPLRQVSGADVPPPSVRKVELPTQKVSAPLVIQFGPAIRSFRELPIILGKHPKADFVLPHPAILDQHMQIFFYHGQYWVKDLSGRNQIRINDGPIDFQAALSLNDIISLAPQGPAFCFLGDGRLAEVAPPPGDAPPSGPNDKNTPPEQPGSPEKKSSSSLWSKLKSRF